jgi:hypothetical protein
VSATDKNSKPGEFIWMDSQTPVEKSAWDPGYPKEFSESMLYTSAVLNTDSIKLRDQKHNRKSFFLCELNSEFVDCV